MIQLFALLIFLTAEYLLVAFITWDFLWMNSVPEWSSVGRGILGILNLWLLVGVSFVLEDDT